MRNDRLGGTDEIAVLHLERSHAGPRAGDVTRAVAMRLDVSSVKHGDFEVRGEVAKVAARG